MRVNRRRAQLICAGTGAVPGLVVAIVLAVAVNVVVGVVVGVVLAVVLALGVWRGATGYVVRLLGARPARPEEVPRLANVVDGLCATFGVPVPEIRVVDDPVPNACSVGSSPRTAVLVVTSGLLSFGLIETEAVVAHELAHVKCHDTVVGAVSVLALAPLAAGRTDGLLHALVGRGREYRADQLATEAVRYPPGLADALVSMAAAPPPPAGSLFAGRRGAATRWLWVDPMAGRRGPDGAEPDPTGELDATSVRIATLAER